MISANGENGVKIMGAGVELYNNLIGTNVDGTQALGNELHGVLMSSSNNQVGGRNKFGGNGTKNIISGNKGDCIRIEAGSNDNSMVGTNIGTNSAGTLPLGNGGNGVSMLSSGNSLGGAEQPTIINVITANAGHGVLVANGTANSRTRSRLIMRERERSSTTTRSRQSRSAPAATAFLSQTLRQSSL